MCIILNELVRIKYIHIRRIQSYSNIYLQQARRVVAAAASLFVFFFLYIHSILISLLSKYINHIIFHIYPFRCRHRRRMFIKQSKYTLRLRRRTNLCIRIIGLHIYICINLFYIISTKPI